MASEQGGRSLDPLIPDFLHAMHYFLCQKDGDRVVWYWEAISEYLWMHSLYTDFLAAARYALAAEQFIARASDDDARRRAVLNSYLAFGCLETGKYAEAEGYLREAEALYRGLGDQREIARILRYRANRQCFVGDYAAAALLCQEALALLDEAARAIPTLPVDRHPLYNLFGVISLQQGELRAARRALLLALRAASHLTVDRTYWSLAPLLNLGQLAERTGQPARALHYYQRCLALTEDGENRGLRADTLIRSAEVLSAAPGASLEDTAERRERARRLAQEALALYRDTGKWHETVKAQRLLDRLANPHPEQ